MKIAFDCKGTLLGVNSNDKVVRLYRWLERKGHKLIIWSNMYSYALEAAKKHKLKGECTLKYGNFETEQENFVDVAIDDEKCDWLATKKLILVKDIPEDENLFEQLIG
jgi:hypothetical protein